MAVRRRNTVREVETDGGGEVGSVYGDFDKDVQSFDRRRIDGYCDERRYPLRTKQVSR